MGANGFTQLGYPGDGTTPGTVPRLFEVTAVATGAKHSLALLSEGTLKAWGINDSGALGNGTVGGPGGGPDPVINLSGVKAIAAGGTHNLALLSDGTVMAWGGNGFGQLGNGSTSGPSGTPAPVINLSGVKAIAAGSSHSLALLTDGTVKAWGSNADGQLGSGSTGGTSGTPGTVISLSGVKAIAAGGAHSLALRSNGTVRAWGANGEGQLGNGSTGAASGTPGTVVNLSGVKAIAAGGAHNVALSSNGTIKTWGANAHGQLGNGTIDPSGTPRTIATGLADIGLIVAGNAHTLAR